MQLKMPAVAHTARAKQLAPWFVLTALLILPALSACQTLSSEECVAADWQVIGESDGAAGYEPQSRFGDHAKSCEKAGIIPNQELWYAGYKIGLERYCTPLNGLVAGQSGKGYANVCPPTTSDGFLRGYSLGKSQYSKKAELRRLQARIDARQTEINSIQEQIGQGKTDAQAGRLTIDRLQFEIRSLWQDMSRLQIELGRVDDQIIRFRANPTSPSYYSGY